MKRLRLLLALAAFFSCNDKPAESSEEEKRFSYVTVARRFREVSLPYSLSDTDLLKNTDTATLRHPAFTQLITDSVKQALFGKGARMRLVPLVRFGAEKGEQYLLAKAVSGSRKAALLLTFGKDGQFGAAFPFLIPDNDLATSQVSTVDKAYSVSRSVTRKSKDDVVTEGKDVYVYNDAAKQFTLIMTDVLNEQETELVNPIDTFSKKHKWTGDYGRDKRNVVSIRDGRNENEFVFYVHFEKEDGVCWGELKGTALMTSSRTAVYRQGGDPCVLEFNFTSSSVSLREAEGCGVHRGVKCLFDGSFPKKREPKPKSSKKARK